MPPGSKEVKYLFGTALNTDLCQFSTKQRLPSSRPAQALDPHGSLACAYHRVSRPTVRSSPERAGRAPAQARPARICAAGANDRRQRAKPAGLRCFVLRTKPGGPCAQRSRVCLQKRRWPHPLFKPQRTKERFGKRCWLHPTVGRKPSLTNALYSRDGRAQAFRFYPPNLPFGLAKKEMNEYNRIRAVVLKFYF